MWRISFNFPFPLVIHFEELPLSLLPGSNFIQITELKKWGLPQANVSTFRSKLDDRGTTKPTGRRRRRRGRLRTCYNLCYNNMHSLTHTRFKLMWTTQRQTAMLSSELTWFGSGRGGVHKLALGRGVHNMIKRNINTHTVLTENAVCHGYATGQFFCVVQGRSLLWSPTLVELSKICMELPPTF